MGRRAPSPALPLQEEGDTLVFSGSQTCGILLFRTRAESSFGEQKVKDSDRLELDRLLKSKLEELIASVRPMSAKNCEQIVRAARQKTISSPGRTIWRTTAPRAPTPQQTTS